MRINNYSFKYVCVLCCLKIDFYCLTFSAMLNLNSADFTTPNQSSEILILKTEMLLEFQNKTNIWNYWAVINTFWIRLRIVRYRFVKYRFIRYTLKTSCKTKNCYAEDVFKTCLQDLFMTCLFNTSSKHVLKATWRRFQDQQMFAGNIWICF